MSKILKLIVGIVVIVLIIWLIVSNAGSPSASSDTIKIGYYGPSTGPVAASTGLDIVTGFKIAHEQRHMIGDKKVEVIYEDDACDPQKAVSAVNKLINIDKVKIVVSGVCSGSTLAGAPIAEQNKVILFTPVSTTPKLTTAGDYVFRTSASAVVTAETIAKYLLSSSYKKIAILVESAEYPIGIRDAFLADIAKDPSRIIVANESSAPKEVDVRSQLTKIAQAQPDVLVTFMNSTITANAVLKQKSDLRLKMQLIGNEYFIQNDVIATPVADNIIASTYKYDSEHPAIKALVSEFTKRVGKIPSQDLYVALAYDGYSVLFDAMSACGGDDPECIKKVLYAVKDYHGASGVITIDQNGDTKREFVLKRVIGGKLIEVK